MIGYSIYTCSVSKFSQILKDERFITQLPIPRFLCDRMRSKLILKRNDISLQDDEQKELFNDFYKASLYIRILTLQTIHRSLSVKVTSVAKNIFKHFFFKEYDPSLLDEIPKKINKMKMVYEAETDINQEEFNFDEYISHIESYLKKDLSQVYIYNLPTYEKQALAKARIGKSDDPNKEE
jgi:hypothetical protein